MFSSTSTLIPPSDETASSHQKDEPSIVDDFMYGSNVAQSHVTIRLGFIRKVYGILTCQLALTTLIGAACISVDVIKEFIQDNKWIVVVNLVATFIALIALMVKRTEYPANYYLLGAFTLFESISIGFVASFYDISIVIQAFFLTTAVVGCLTLYTFQSKRDFRFMGAALFSLLTLLVLGSFMRLFLQSAFAHTALSVISAFLFSAFIIYDTQMIMKHLHAEEYIVGVINLYLDIINLFLEILRILDSMKRN